VNNRPDVAKWPGDETLLIEPYSTDHVAWSALVDQSFSATLYHRKEWIELLARCYGFSIFVAGVYRRDELLSACVLARAKNPFSKRFISLPFSDTCEPLIRPGGDADLLPSILPAQGPKGFTYEIRGLGAARPWETASCFQEWTLDLNRPRAALQRALETNFKRNLKQTSARSVEIERGASIALLKRFYAMQLETRRRLGVPPQPWRFFKMVHEVFTRNSQLEIWIAHDKGKDEAAAVFVRDKNRIYFKWGARRTVPAQTPSGANHLLLWSAVEAFAGQADVLDLGRTDIRNEGLNRFKRGLGGSPRPLPYSFYPRLRGEPSSEVLQGRRAMLASLWRRFPLPVTRIVGTAIYRFLG
jgi:hypothetical protein